jgi:hypothetical protein
MEKLVENTLEDGPIEKIDKLAYGTGHFLRVITPRGSHKRTTLRVSLNPSVRASGLVMEEQVEVAMQIRKSLFTMIGIITRRCSSPFLQIEKMPA